MVQCLRAAVDKECAAATMLIPAPETVPIFEHANGDFPTAPAKRCGQNIEKSWFVCPQNTTRPAISPTFGSPSALAFLTQDRGTRRQNCVPGQRKSYLANSYPKTLEMALFMATFIMPWMLVIITLCLTFNRTSGKRRHRSFTIRNPPTQRFLAIRVSADFIFVGITLSTPISA